MNLLAALLIGTTCLILLALVVGVLTLALLAVAEECWKEKIR